VVIHGKNTGPGGARRLGLSQARGEYVGFVDADDYIEGNMFETLYATAQQHNVDIVNCGHFSEWPGRTKPVTSGLEKNRILRHEDVERYHKDFSNYLEPFWFPWRNIYRREFLCENQITFGEEGVGGDTNFNLRAFFLADSIYALDLPLYHYVQNPLSITLARFRDALLDDLMFTYERRLEIYEMFVSRKEAKVGLSRYVVEKYIPRLLMNAWHSPRHDFLQRIKAISTDQRIQEALHLYQPSGKLDPVLDVVMRLLKRRMYRTTWLVLGARFGTQSS
jgi:glycosyltransferase involved in cell wall biosynthesis